MMKIPNCSLCNEKIGDTYYYDGKDYFHIECAKNNDKKFCKHCGGEI